MLLTDARRRGAGGAGRRARSRSPSRTGARWDKALIAEGSALVEQTLATTTALGPYQLQAAIAAVHDEAASLADTDWTEILALYELLAQVSPGPMVSLGKAVAVAMVHGPEAASPRPMSSPGRSPGTIGSTRSAGTCSRWRAI